MLLNTTDAKLFRITTQTGKTHYIWRDTPDKYEYEFPAACRAFLENDDLLDDDIFDVKIRQEITPDEDIFCFAGYVYYLHRKQNGNLVIRRICAYSSQRIIEQIVSEDFHDIDIENIYLSNFFVMEDNKRKYVMTCWGVVYQEGFLYIPIFDEDRHFIYERDVQSFIREEIPVGTVFKANDMYYQTAADEQGKFYLNFSDNPFVFKRTKFHTDGNKSKALIIKMNFKKESNGI